MVGSVRSRGTTRSVDATRSNSPGSRRARRPNSYDSPQADKASVTKVLEKHDAIDQRWFGYELDLATLIEFPMMTDMREPLTLAFHRAKIRADDLRPTSAD